MTTFDRQTDGRTPGKNNKSPNPKGGILLKSERQSNTDKFTLSDKTNDIGSVRIHPAFFMWPPKKLIRLGGCPEFPESSLGENSKWFVLSCLRKYFGHIS